ncbi:sugar phosphate nucleotidyltransferase [Nitrospira sp. M1]
MHNPQRKNGNHWAIVLAGGEGQRMRPFIQKWLGYPKPKQYCAFIGKRSMLQHTWDRADQAGHLEHKVTVIDKTHRQEIFRQLNAQTKGRILIQPKNCDTAVGIFLALTYINHWDPYAMVTIYPSDHFITPHRKFKRMIRETVSVVRRVKERIVLLGAIPNAPEGEYGWIRPGKSLAGNSGMPVHTVEEFIEKPDEKAIQALAQKGGIWNTMIVTAYGNRLWSLGEQWCPDMLKLFQRLQKTIGSAQEALTLEAIYQDMPQKNFSKNFLECIVMHLVTMELQGILWSDWGRPERIVETLEVLGKEPTFLVPQLST